MQAYFTSHPVSYKKSNATDIKISIMCCQVGEHLLYCTTSILFSLQVLRGSTAEKRKKYSLSRLAISVRERFSSLQHAAQNDLDPSSGTESFEPAMGPDPFDVLRLVLCASLLRPHLLVVPRKLLEHPCL